MNYRENGQKTVAELISDLQKMPMDAIVWHEGCDCNGACGECEYYESDKSILIKRVN
jgi:hypothetical protein